MEKLRIGVIFGGISREREVSFAGGRTVYDNLNKSLFEAVPVFIDSFGNFILLNWENIYKGSIRDFYPPADMLPPSPNSYQVYAESLGDPEKAEQLRLIHKVGAQIQPSALPGLIDIAFLCLHGTDGEDGRIQGLLEYYRIPYTGSGIFSSATGMNKSLQKQLMKNAGFNIPSYRNIKSNEWLDQSNRNRIYSDVKSTCGFPCVIKSANQGSSIGISILNGQSSEQDFINAVNKSFFIRVIQKKEWDQNDYDSRVKIVRELSDIREGIGMPVRISNRVIYHPEELLSVLIDLFSGTDDEIVISAVEGESEVLAESFIEGKEFSCIVIEDENGLPVALPPTEIRKGKELFDYRSKYLPGLSRKITPIQIPDEQLNAIRTNCEQLFSALHFNVYARIDGFIKTDGTVFLNDPNTTSGMMPSSFFFHQAAEIGMNPSQFITFILFTSLKCRMNDLRNYTSLPDLIRRFTKLLEADHKAHQVRQRAAVILGGYSSERHISVESGRNIYEKLSSSDKYEAIPVFLTGSDDNHLLYTLPVNILLKDNADDIREKIENYKVHPVIHDIIRRCEFITSKFGSVKNLEAPRSLSYAMLAEEADVVFIALHGRPGEDGSVQKHLQKVNLPYNGSGPESSGITIDKYQTNEILRKHNLNVAAHMLVKETEWKLNQDQVMDNIRKNFTFPVVAKPVDDGCSSAVKIVRSNEELTAYMNLIFRENEELETRYATRLKIRDKEEFPRKKVVLIEELISPWNAVRFLEITGGMLTSTDEKGIINFEVFEASEALSEGDVLSLEEKFLAGQGQNITPARYSADPSINKQISSFVKSEFEKAARLLNIEGYARIDAFVRIFKDNTAEVIFIEVNSLPGMTPATCIFHQAAIAHYKPYEFIDKILDYGVQRNRKQPERINN